MNREIKFRMYRDGRMQQAWSISTDERYNFDFQKCETEAGEGGILMQYTGLKDKNGIEIYEGDIILSESLANKLKDFRLKWMILKCTVGL